MENPKTKTENQQQKTHGITANTINNNGNLAIKSQEFNRLINRSMAGALSRTTTISPSTPSVSDENLGDLSVLSYSPTQLNTIPEQLKPYYIKALPIIEKILTLF